MQDKVYYVGLCASCWTMTGQWGETPLLENDVCVVCRDSVPLLFTPEPAIVPFLSRFLELQQRRMRDLSAAYQYALAVRGPAWVPTRHSRLNPLEIMARWDTSVVEFWPAVGHLLHDELKARVVVCDESETESERMK